MCSLGHTTSVNLGKSDEDLVTIQLLAQKELVACLQLLVSSVSGGCSRGFPCRKAGGTGGTLGTVRDSYVGTSPHSYCPVCLVVTHGGNKSFVFMAVNSEHFMSNITF